eukprot:TRINITY_DN8561_c0_g1_i1.p1 TRINITY_DN8561_c0_g1~~TRINITY_DN8561_c0_g1_i1.p1  ORF type:complete len:104 (-),score=22.19 TRINITY_DN8561_c0_g1_i1:387-698(-)
MHDTYWTRGDDGKIYSTWHPPLDFNPETGTYCTYGHDHGDDPRGSEVFSLSGWPAFGYVNELHSIVEGSGARHEDHFGHKSSLLMAGDCTTLARAVKYAVAIS